VKHKDKFIQHMLQKYGLAPLKTRLGDSWRAQSITTIVPCRPNSILHASMKLLTHLRLQIGFCFWSTMTVTFRICEQGDDSVAAATKSQDKSSFVREFLRKHPEGNVKAVNAGWTAAGMEGTIGDTLIYQMRADMGLSGKLRTKSGPKTAAKAKSPTKMSKSASSPGKSMFVKEYLNDHPGANVSAVNAAWQAAGFDGAISPALVNKMRARAGLTGNLRGSIKKSTPSATGKKRGRPREETATAVNRGPVGQPRGTKNDRTNALLGLEAEIDKLIFQVMFIGDLPEVETSLREARRRVYGALNS
jgi:hypothetical protein